ncbi:MAG: hypothetical protein HWN81_03495 [Candidatus Lokiarchaeota archaeon]|nr:hypothetical protein [Candidatus Lokiarchaeota archaeon]
MLLEEIINKNKIKADDYISVFMITSYLLFALFFRIEAFMSIVVYPFASLGIFGVLKIVNALNKRNPVQGKGNKMLVGIIYIIISISFLGFLFTMPSITSHIIISLISFPLLIVGFAGIVKGMLIDIYLVKHRVISIIIGMSTIIACFIAFSSIVNSFLFNIILLVLTVLINVLSRAALYLSEYGLSLIHIKNFKLFFYIISDYLVYIDAKGNIVLSKFE